MLLRKDVRLMASARKKYTREFKVEAVRLVEKGRSIREVARDLGITEGMLYQWKSRVAGKGELAFPGNGRIASTDLEEENRRLRKELAEAKQDREILKKAAAYFAKHQA